MSILDNFSYITRLPEDHPQGGYPYDFIECHSNKLVITIGDSWTWGADIDDRLSNCYGRIIADELSADFLNLGQCGSCNLHIIYRIRELDKIIDQLEYDKIFIICTFTEAARSFDGPYDQDVKYYNWFENNVFQNVNDCYKILEFHNGLYTEELVNFEKSYKNVRLISGTNFVNAIGIKNKLLKKSWIQLYCESMLNKIIDSNCYVMSSWVIDNLKERIKNFKAKDEKVIQEWFLCLIDQASMRNKIVVDSKDFRQHGHPSIELHKLWANYILQEINND